jgi:hypothetical protein
MGNKGKVVHTPVTIKRYKSGTDGIKRAKLTLTRCLMKGQM